MGIIVVDMLLDWRSDLVSLVVVLWLLVVLSVVVVVVFVSILGAWTTTVLPLHLDTNLILFLFD